MGVGDVASSTISTAAPRSSNVGSGTAQNGNVADSRERENEPKSGEVGVGGSGQTELTLYDFVFYSIALIIDWYRYLGLHHFRRRISLRLSLAL